MQSEKLAEQQGSTQAIDLSAIAEAHPVNQQTAILDLNTFDATQLTLLEVLDMSEKAGVDPENLGEIIKTKTAKQMRLMYAIAWVIARRANLRLTFEEVATWKLTVIGEVDESLAETNAKRAAIVVGAASVSGLPPKEAANLTVAELGAYRERNVKANRAARRRRAG